MKNLRKLLSLFLIATILCHPLSQVSHLVTAAEVTVEDVVVIEDEIIEDTLTDDISVTGSYIEDIMFYDDEEQVYRATLEGRATADSYTIDYTAGETSQEELLSQLPPEYEWYDINWGSVLGKIAVGSTVVVVVGTVHTTSGGLMAVTPFFGVSPPHVIKKAFVGGVTAAALNVALNKSRISDASGFVKYAIEGFADGFMFGALESVGAGLFKRLVLPKKFQFSSGLTGKLTLNGDVIDDSGKTLGKTFFDKETKQLYLSEGKDLNRFRVFDQKGRELSNLSKVKLAANKVFLSGQGKKAVLHYTDDVGQLYRQGNKLLPNTTYRLSNNQYKTDGLGRIVEVSIDQLELKTHSGRRAIMTNMDDLARGSAKAGDDRGHLIADLFGGDNSVANLVPMDSTVNRGSYKQVEQIWKKALESGQSVSGRIKIRYSDNSFRPDEFDISSRLGDDLFEQVIKNSSIR